MGDDAELYMDMQQPWFWNNLSMNDDDCVDDDAACSRYFLVDYENVNHGGLNGILKLSEEDCVRIYYSEAADTMTFGLHRRIKASRADFKYIKVQVPIQNAVDCRILFDLRDLIRDDREAEYYIVSKDTDFDKAISDYRRWGLSVKRILEIAKRDETSRQDLACSVVTPIAKKPEKPAQPKKSEKSKREAQVRTFIGQNFKDKSYKEHKEEIIQIILTCRSKQAVNNALMKIYPGETVSVIYKTIQPLIKDYPGK